MMAPTKNANGDGFAAPIADLPPAIQTALARIVGYDGGGLETLTGRERMLLARLVRCLDLSDPRQSIRVSVPTLAVAMHTCDKTVQRTLGSLKVGGWIRRDQIKERAAGMQVADTWLTDYTLELLGLNGPQRGRRGHAGGHVSAALASSADAAVGPADDPQTPAADQQAAEPESGPTSDMETDRPVSDATAQDQESDACRLSSVSKDSQQSPGFIESQQKEKAIPEDLALLQQMGLKRGAIFKLMGEASKAGHRLGQIVRAVAPLIRQASHPFGYVMKLIGTKRDWSSYTCKAVQVESEALELIKAKEADQAVQSVLEAAMTGGKMLTNAAGKVVWLMRTGVVYALQVADLQLRESLRPYSRVVELEKMAAAVQEGRLFEYQPG